MRSLITASMLTLLCPLVATAQGEWRCDCTTIVASCSAQVSIAERWVDVSSDTPQCSRVDYFIDGMPFVSVVTDGEQRQDWIARSAEPDVLVQSCQVCRDNSGTSTPRPEPQNGNAELEPLIEVAPSYPPEAQRRGLEGYVDVQFTVDPYGSVQNVSVQSAEPANVFDEAAVAAVRRWRYPADESREPQTVSTRVRFELDDYILQLSREPAQAAREERAAVGPRNECVREQAVYNYGEVVEVGLMNACSDPLIVFGCAQGTGQYSGRWVCASSERQQSVLVPANDGRVGAVGPVETPEGARNYEYTANFFVSRAPNSQYWWLACPESDLGCRDDGRQWARSLDRQLASVNPQTRTSLSVSRSY